MHRAALPPQVDGTVEVTEQILEEGSDVAPGTETKRQWPPSGRHGEAAAPRQAIVAVAQARGPPAGAPVRRTFGMSRKPLSSTKTRWAPRRAAFVIRRDAPTLPPLDRRLVAFDRAALRLLATPAQPGQGLPDTGRAKAHPDRRSIRLLGRASGRPSGTLPGAGLPQAALPVSASAPPTAAMAAPAWAWRPRNLSTTRSVSLLSRASCLDNAIAPKLRRQS